MLIKHNKKEYYTVKEFAKLVHKSEPTIRRLVKYGNKIRKLKTVHFVDRLLIDSEELKNFPFTVSGRNNNETYHYDEKGIVVEK